MEYVQLYFVPHRDFDKADISADTAGAIAAFGYLIIVRKEVTEAIIATIHQILSIILTEPKGSFRITRGLPRAPSV